MGVLSTSKRILITGASQGIGKHTALRLAAAGHRVVLAARNRSALEAVANEVRAAGGSAEVLPMDLRDAQSVSSAMQELLSSGPCDVVVNNAGTCIQAPYSSRDDVSLREEMEVNYWGAQRVTSAVLPSMIARRQGSIVNVSSLLGFVASATTCNYCGTKAALTAWTHSLRGEVARHGVRVTVFVAPHTQTASGQAAQFDGVISLPVEYTAKELCVAIDRAPRQYAGSPVYRLLLRLAGWFPVFMERQMANSVERVLESASPLLPGPTEAR